MSPADVGDLTLPDFEQLTAEIDAYLSAVKKGNQ